MTITFKAYEKWCLLKAAEKIYVNTEKTVLEVLQNHPFAHLNVTQPHDILMGMSHRVQ